jgi:hypothetical protein
VSWWTNSICWQMTIVALAWRCAGIQTQTTWVHVPSAASGSKQVTLYPAWDSSIRNPAVRDGVQTAKSPVVMQVLLTKLRTFAPHTQLVCISATLGGLDSVLKWLDARLFLTNFRPVQLQEHVCLGGAVFTCSHDARGESAGGGATRACGKCEALTTWEPAAKRQKCAEGAGGPSRPAAAAAPARGGFQTAQALDTGRKATLRGQLEERCTPKKVLEGELCAVGLHFERVLAGSCAPAKASVADRVCQDLAMEVMHVRRRSTDAQHAA